MKLKIKYRIVLGLGLALGVFLNSHYRTMVYNSEYSDFGLADVGSNFFIVLLMCCCLWSFNISLSKLKVIDIILVTFFYLIAEILSYFFPFIGTFDLKDIIGIPIGTLLTGFTVFIFEREQFDVLLPKKSDH